LSDLIHISAEDSADELRSFFQWLQNEHAVRRHALISWEPSEPREGELGGALDVVKLVIDSNFQVLNLALRMPPGVPLAGNQPR
jgi:hypothetical protein